ncbi:MAG: TonB-dependent receptor [Prosthecobacter sp.]|nr:TonB-dependent receptor [Prosthecobacter sp.]
MRHPTPALLLLGLPLFAAEPAKLTDGFQSAELPELVITATRSESDPKKIPAQVRTLDSTQMLERQIRTLPEALREIPGVNVQKTSNGQGSPFIRGFTGFRNLALIDGIRFNNSIFREGPNQYWNTIDALAIDHMELVPGQGSVLYGSDGIGGTLNMLTKSSGFQNEQEGFFFHGLSSWRGSTAEESNVLRQEVQFGQGQRWGLHLGASLKYFGDVHAAGIGDQPSTGYDEWAYDARLDIALNDHWTLTGVHQQVRQNDVWRTHATVRGISWQGTTIGTDLKRAYDQERTLSYLRLVGEDLEGIIDSASLTISLQSMDEIEHRIRRVADNRQNYSQTEVKTLGLDLQLQSQTALGKLTYGIDYYRDWVNSGSQRYRLNGTFNRNEIQGPVGDDAGYDLFGAYLLDEIDLNDRVHVFLGGRYTYAAAEVGRYDNSTTPQRYDSLRDNWQNFSATGRLMIDLDDKDRFRLFLGVSQGFRSPNLSDLSRLDIARTGELELPSPGLKPEEFINYEVGLKADTEHFTGSLSYFYTNINEMIVRRATGAFVGPNRVVEKKNGGDGFIHGIELVGDYRITPNWTIFGHVTWTEGQVDQFVGNTNQMRAEPATRVVPLMWRGGIRWQTVDNRWWAELVALGQSDMDRLNTNDRRDTDRIPSNGNPGFTWLTARGGWQVTQNFGVTLALENLLDDEIRYAGSGSNEAGFGAVLGMTVRW